MHLRTRILCLFAAVLAVAPVVWTVPAHAAGSVIQAHGENRGPGGGGDDDDRDDDDRDDDDDGGGRTTATTPAGTTAAPGAPASAAPVSVSILDGAFSPASISIAPGSQVAWTNTDGSRHTATADSGTFDSGSLNSGATFSFTFPSPGTFAYFCAFHDEMRGTVTVGAAQASSAVPARPTAPSTSSTPTTAATAATAAPRGIATVEARDYEFTPSRLTVGRGAEVTWRNTGQAPHTATGEGFDSGELAAGQTFVHRFDTPGTYDYRCELHPRMQGAVEVVADATAAPVAAEVKRFPLERIAAGGIVGAPILLLVGAVFLWGRR